VTKTAAIVFLALLVLVAMPGAYASTVVLSDVALNDDGAFTDGIQPASPPSALVFAVDPSGLGTITFTGTGSPGTYFMDMYFDYDVSVPFWNEYGIQSGTAAKGQRWQIDQAVADSDDLNFPNPTLFANVQDNKLADKNFTPGTEDNSFFNCGANGGGAVDKNCNTDVAFGMGFNYRLAANQEAVITFTTSQSPCSGAGLCLADVHPVDAFNTSAQAVYLSATLSIQSTGPQTPEPASWLLVGSAALIGFGVFRRKLGGK
jgi:hypothetical protein